MKLWGWRVAGKKSVNGVLSDVVLLDVTKALLTFRSHTISRCVSRCGCIFTRREVQRSLRRFSSYET